MSAAQTGVTLPRSMQVLERGWVSSNNIVFIDPHAQATSTSASGAQGTVVDTGYVRHAAQTIELVRHARRNGANVTCNCRPAINSAMSVVLRISRPNSCVCA